jgi:hypothetical protein
MAPTGAAKTGRSTVRPNKVKEVSTGLFSQMVSMLTHSSCHF